MIAEDLELRLITGSRDVSEFIDWLGRPREILGFDTETSGLSPERDRIRLCQFGDEEVGWAMSWEDWRGLAREVIEQYQGPLVAHNSKFDIRMFCKDTGMSVAEWPWHRTHDTQGLAHINDSQRPKGLKPLADRFIDGRISQAQKKLDEGMKQNKWDWGTVPIDYPPYWQYAALDPVLAVILYKYFMGVGTIDMQLYDMEMAGIRVAAKMEETGFLIDRTYSEETANKLDAYAATMRGWMKSEWGLDNPTPMKLVKFFQEQGVELIDKQTNGGNQAMDKHVLQTTDHVVAREVLNLRHAEKMSGTYLHNFINLIDENDVLHASINTMAARTGRMSISEPSLQNLPRRDPLVRNAFIPRPGNTLISCDYDQIEARLTAHFSNDKGLIDAFLSPEDFFCVVATQAFGKEVVKGMTERDLIKGVVYGKVYGASVMTMAASAGVPPQQMQVTNALFDTNYPRVHQFMNEVINEGKSRKRMSEDGRGFVITPYKRKLKSDPGREYTLVNYLIQCHASEILKKKIVELDAALPSYVDIILPVHDEIIFDCPVEAAPEIGSVIGEIMTDTESYRVPITASAEILGEGKAWGSKYE